MRASFKNDSEPFLLAQLAEVYREVDALYQGWTCDVSTECCRFGVTGREPYVTSIERRALEKAVAAKGGWLSERKAALPLIETRKEAICPLLGRDNRCSVYDDRPFGCRTFFCDRAKPLQKVERKDLARLLLRVKDIAVRHEPDGDRGRPLRQALGRRA